MTDISIFNIQSTSWDLLKRHRYAENFQSDSTALSDIAIICESIANDGIGVLYNYFGSGGTYGKMADVHRYLKNYAGFDEADLKRSYSVDNIIEMLEEDNPIIVGAFDITARSGHSWIIDGMIAQFVNQRIGTTSQRLHLLRAPLFHCNWGWNGLHDGYYTSEIFDTKIFNEKSNADENGAIITEPGDSTYSHQTTLIDVYYGEASRPRFHYRHIIY